MKNLLIKLILLCFSTNCFALTPSSFFSKSKEEQQAIFGRKIFNKLSIEYICNTKKVIQKAIKWKKEIIEIDLQMTKDLKIILRHDPKVMYKKKIYQVCDLTLDELMKSTNIKKTLFQLSKNNSNTLTFDEFLKIKNINKVKWMLHLNNWFSHVPDYNIKIILLLCKRLREGNNLENVISFTSYDIHQLLILRDSLPSATLCYSTNTNDDNKLIRLDNERQEITLMKAFKLIFFERINQLYIQRISYFEIIKYNNFNFFKIFESKEGFYLELDFIKFRKFREKN